MNKTIKKVEKNPKNEGSGISTKQANRLREKIFKSSAQQKMFNYLIDLTTRPTFKKDLYEFRKKFGIDKDGYKKIVYKKSQFDKKIYFSYPNHDLVEKQDNYRLDLISFAKKYEMGLLWVDVLESYIFYNKWFAHPMGSMIEVLDVANEFFLPFPEKKDEELDGDYVEKMIKDYPVAIFLNPYVGERDIVDYVKRTFKLEIEPYLKTYRKKDSRLGKAKKKNMRILRRNIFIYQNKDKKKAEIIRLVSEKFGDDLDYNYIARIIKETEELVK